MNAKDESTGEDKHRLVNKEALRIIRKGVWQETPADHRPDTNQGAESTAVAQQKAQAERIKALKVLLLLRPPTQKSPPTREETEKETREKREWLEARENSCFYCKEFDCFQRLRSSKHKVIKTTPAKQGWNTCTNTLPWKQAHRHYQSNKRSARQHYPRQ